MSTARAAHSSSPVADPAIRQSLADRVERGLEACRMLHAERRAYRSQAAAETDLARRLRVQLHAVRAKTHLQPSAQVDALWHAIGLSETYGALRERMALLMLADAFFRANERLETLAAIDGNDGRNPYSLSA